MSVDALRVLTAALSQNGGGETVINQLGTLPGAEFVPAQPGGLFRRGEPSRLTLGDHAYTTAGKVGAQLQVSHVVRGVALQTRTLGPADAARSLVDGLQQLIDSGIPDVTEAIEAALYGLAVAIGLET